MRPVHLLRVILCYTMQYDAILCYPMRYYAILCYTMRYYAILCYTMLYYAILCYTDGADSSVGRSTREVLVSSLPSVTPTECTPSPLTKSFPTKSPRVKLSGRLPIKFDGHVNSHPFKSRVCLSQTLRNPNS